MNQTCGDLSETSDKSELVDHTLNDDGSDSQTYYFESDHVALKSNPDYQSLLRSIALLESQRIQAIKDLDKLYEGQTKALQDPIGFVECLQNGKKFDFPSLQLQQVATIPSIDWEKYTSNVQFTSFGVRHMTRLKKQLVHGTTDEELKSSGQTGMSYCPTVDDCDVRVVRGRIKTDAKSATFNQLWTVEEQKRLEELLVTYPPEEVEAKRWQKIASALGNRTVQQVASRVQKYFIKLTKAGLPVPGRIPNLNAYNKKSGHRHHRYNKMYYPSSTFLHAFEPPVYMSDDEDFKSYEDDSSSFSQWNLSPDVSDEEDIPPDLRCTQEYQELIRWKMIKKERQMSEDKVVHHVGYKCDNCDREPIVGTRWHCVDCPMDAACDFCDDCVDCVFESSTHNTSHRLKAVKQAGNPTIDQDYTKFMPGDYNYLDPNYMPAS
ncbi:ZZ-type zinc finger-containing protein 3-like [Gigantopelta aegis]|uniref:ZZ-type zinc finger-containing protein 3-like n=1 Tax=Gigantopelta aegis TaxID=1735272 RepID=UPI001B887C74|nr:ZZ-type zinc finger-containing protein 3-like [Gigantopelta aegis]